MNTAVSYLTERFPLRVFGPSWALLTGAALWIGNTGSIGAALTAASLTLLLVAQYRLWDDLEDVDRDRAVHPERVLVQAPLAPFRTVLAALTVATLAVSAWSGMAFFLTLAVHAAFAVAYRRLRLHLTDRSWRYGVLLLKYPAFLTIASAAAGHPASDRLAVGLVAAYGVAAAYERWHHDRLHAGAFS